MRRIILFIVIAGYFLSVHSQNVNVRSGETAYALIEASRQKMMGNLDEAVKLLKLTVSSDPECAAAWYELASIYSATAQLTEAEEFIAKAYNLDKENYWYIVAYADVLQMNAKYDMANKVLAKGLQKSPENELTFLFQIADNYFLKGSHNKALKVYNRIEKKYGMSEMAEIHKIDIYKELKNDKMVVRSFEKLLSSDPANIPLYLMYADYLNESGNIDSAIVHFEKVIELDPSNIFAVSNLADLYGKIGNMEKSYYYLQNAFLSGEISDQKKLQTLAFIINDKSRINRDKSSLKPIIDTLLIRDSENYDLLLIAYDFYYKSEDYQQSLSIIKRMVDLKDDNYIIWAQAVYNANMLSKNDDVIELGNRALKLFPNKDDLRIFVALAHFQKNEYLPAYNILKETEERFSDPELKRQKMLLLAETAYKSGFSTEAFTYFEDIINNEPDNIYVKNNYSYYLALEHTECRCSRSSPMTLTTRSVAKPPWPWPPRIRTRPSACCGPWSTTRTMLSPHRPSTRWRRERKLKFLKPRLTAAR